MRRWIRKRFIPDEEAWNDRSHEYRELTVDEIGGMWARLDQKRKSRLWFGGDTDLLDAICDAQAALERIALGLIEERRA